MENVGLDTKICLWFYIDKKAMKATERKSNWNQVSHVIVSTINTTDGLSV